MQCSIGGNIKNYKQFKSTSVGIWLNKLWSVHSMKYYAAIKKNEMDLYVLTWISMTYQRMKKVDLCDSV